MAQGVPYDRTLRVVMWLDAFLSLAAVAVCMAATVLVVAMGRPGDIGPVVGLAAIASAVPLAAFGAVTAVLLALRMRRGHYQLPVDLRLPLPSFMRPEPADRTGSGLNR